MRKIHIIGGGTVAHVRPHLAICAPAYGKTTRDLYNILVGSDFDGLVYTYTTKMAGNRKTIWQRRSGVEDMEPLNLETNADVAKLLDDIVVLDPDPSIVFLPAALVDFDATGVFADVFGRGTPGPVGKQHPRLSSTEQHELTLRPAEKVIRAVRKQRKDVFLVGFKTTTGASPQAQFDAGLRLVKQASCNLVLANDLETKLNMVVTPEQAPHYVSTDRRHVLRQLVGMALERSKGHFTRSTVHPGPLIQWSDEQIPASLRTVVNYCIKRGAYKSFLGKTVGHFALRVPVDASIPLTYITSRRGVDFNKLDEVGLVMVQAANDTDGTAWVVVDGAKPSVGGQSQRIIFAEHPDVDCIVHFHCPLRPEHRNVYVNGPIPVRSQEPYECGSHECGQNTSNGLKVFETYNGAHKYPVKAVMLDKHGPNIVFNRSVDPQAVIDFIEKYWDLERSTSEVVL